MLENHLFLAATAAAGAAGIMGCACMRPKEITYDEEDEDVAIPTMQAIKEFKKRGKSSEQLAREDAYESLPRNRSKPRVTPIPGSIVREAKEYAPRVHPLKLRTKHHFSEPDMLTNPIDIWANPSSEEYQKAEKDAQRWAWNSFITVDEGTQLVSTEVQYASEGYGVRIIVIPTLRLADRQFYDQAMDTIIANRAMVLVESLHSEVQTELFKKMEADGFGKGAYEKVSRAQTQAMALRRGAEGAQGVINAVGGNTMTLDYFQALVELHCDWLLADHGLSKEAMENIGITVNHKKSFNALCALREASLFSMVDKCLRASGSAEDWKALTGQEGRDGEKVICIPWNGRHCDRLEKFLVQYRGFVPRHDTQVHRIIFDPRQTSKMVLKAVLEDQVETGHDKLHDIPGPTTVVPEEFMPPYHFGPLAEDMKAKVC